MFLRRAPKMVLLRHDHHIDIDIDIVAPRDPVIAQMRRSPPTEQVFVVLGALALDVAILLDALGADHANFEPTEHLRGGEGRDGKEKAAGERGGCENQKNR